MRLPTCQSHFQGLQRDPGVQMVIHCMTSTVRLYSSNITADGRTPLQEPLAVHRQHWFNVQAAPA
jgi:hypothetical protein